MIEQRNIGKSGLRVSAIGFGCNNFGRSLDLAASRPVIHKALDLGITFFDCADVYGRRGGAETWTPPGPSRWRKTSAPPAGG
jgi:aryl-alcohol dehydrogenase-like predicted oxidoreductase